MKMRSTAKALIAMGVTASLMIFPIKNASASGLYRVRESWSNSASQIGAYSQLSNAKVQADANPGYEVYDENGNVVYAGQGSAEVPEQNGEVTVPETSAPDTTTKSTAPAPETKETVSKEGVFTLSAPAPKYVNAGNAASGSSSIGTYPAGEYYIYKEYNGMLNITKNPGVPGAWINPSGSVTAPEATVPAETKPDTKTPPVTTAPVENNESPEAGGKYALSSSAAKYVNASDAAARTGSIGSYPAGDYYVYKSYNGMINITKTPGVPGAWINPGSAAPEKPETTKPVTTAPAPESKPDTSAPSAGETYTLSAAAPKYTSASDASSKTGSTGTYAAGSYYIYKSYNGMINITKTPGVAGGWINPAEIGKAPGNSTTTPAPVDGTDTVGQKIVAEAKKALGTPYVWGGESYAEGGFDCSGLAYYCYQQAGISIPRTADDQYYGMNKVSAPQPGDLVIYGYGSRITHAAIYIGNGQIIHAPDEGEVVKIASMYRDWCDTIGYVRKR